MRAKTAAALTLLVSLLISGCALEIALRAYFGMPIFAWRDWRTIHATVFDTGAANYDPELGWVQAPDYAGGAFNTIAYGIRRNSLFDSSVEQGAILAVGDSFTAGSEVEDAMAWPAQLERMLGRRVLNAGVGGYGTDQTILRAEALIEALSPRIVILGFLTESVLRSGYSVFNAPKPYFIETADGWQLFNQPVPREPPPRAEPAYKMLLSRSFAAHLILSRHRFMDWWYTGDGPQFTRSGADAAAVTCHLLERLQPRLASTETRGIVLMQYGGFVFAGQRGRPAHVQQVLDCAKKLGYPIVDEFDSLDVIAKRSIADLKKNYVMAAGDSSYGHMSPEGNGLIAALLRQSLSDLADPSFDDMPKAASARQIELGFNLIAVNGPGGLRPTHLTVEQAAMSGAVRDTPVFILHPSAATGEYYAVLPWQADSGGAVTFSLYVRLRGMERLRLQIHDADGNAAIGDFATGAAQALAVGKADAVASRIESAADGWSRLELSGRLPGANGSLIIQPFGHEQASIIQAPMLERGNVASAYCLQKNCLLSAGK